MFIISGVVNIMMAMYVRWLLKSISSINEQMDDVTYKISEFSTHLTGLHEMEMFYGDQTLKALMDHSNTLVGDLKNLELILNEEEDDLGQTED